MQSVYKETGFDPAKLCLRPQRAEWPVGRLTQRAFFQVRESAIMKLLDHLEEWLITFLMGGGDADHLRLGRAPLPVGRAIPGLQDWLLSLNFGWAQELCIIMFVWMAKFGAAYGVRTGIHVGVDVLINRLSGPRAASSSSSACWPAPVHRHRRHAGRHFVWENGAHYAFFTLLGHGMSAMFPKARPRPTWSGRPGSSTAPFRWARR
jgi:hypothetical protein